MHPSKLPAELWREIGKRLGSRIAVACFRLVCKVWRSSLPSPTRFTLRVPPPPGATEWERWMGKPSFQVTEFEIYAIAHGKGYVTFGGKDEAGEFRPCECPIWGCKLDFSDYQLARISLVAKSYCIRISFPNFKPSQMVLAKKVRKIVLIYASSGVDANYAGLSDLTLVALLRGGKLALLRLNSNSDWDTNFCDGRRFLNIETYEGQLRAVDCSGRFFLMEHHSLRMTQVASVRREPEQIVVDDVMSFNRFV